MKYVVKLKKEIERTVVVEANSDEEADRRLKNNEYEFSAENVLSYDTYIGYEYVSHTTSNVVITSKQDLKDYFGTNDIERMLFKYTECGCSYLAKEKYISIAGYAENSGDAECPEHRLYFPFTIEEWNSALAEADAEGCELWDEYNPDYND